MDECAAFSVPLMKVAPMFYKEKTFWETRLTDSEQFRDIGSIDNIDFNSNNLDELLVSSLARVSMYDCNSLEVKRTYKTNTQFQVYGGCFRKSDGRLIAAGSEEGKVFVFESANTNPLRVFELKAPTHRILFLDNRLVTFSDDLCVRILDLGTGETIRNYGAPSNIIRADTPFHKDYVRCGCMIDRLIVSGAYDGTVKFWDPRLDQLEPVLNYDHGYAVESFCTRGETLLISVGGNKMHIFDMVAGKTLTSIIPRHHKTITCVANYEDKYLLTGSLNGYVNVIDFNYEYITRFNYDDAQILSMVVNPKLMAVGFNNHNVDIKRFKDFMKKTNNEMAELEKLHSGYFGPNMVTRYFHEAIAESQDPAATHRALLAIKQKKTPIVLNDTAGLYEPIIIPKVRRKNRKHKPSSCRLLLNSFKHSLALEVAVKNQRYDKEDVLYIIQELMKRDKLKVAMIGCKKLIAMMRFLALNLRDIRNNRLLLDASVSLIDLMLKEKSLIQHDNPDYWNTLDLLLEAIDEDLRVAESCLNVGAQLSTVISQY